MSQYKFGEDEQLKAMILSDFEDFSSSENKIDCSQNKTLDKSKCDHQDIQINKEETQIIECTKEMLKVGCVDTASLTTQMDSQSPDQKKNAPITLNTISKRLEKTHKQKDESENEFPQLIKHNSEIPQLHNFLLSKKRINKLTLGSQASRESQQQTQITELKDQLKQKNDQILKLQDTLTKITNCLAKIYSSPELLSKDIEDKELLKIISEGFLSQAKLHLAFLFSSPLILKYKDAQSNSLKSQTIVSIDHAQEFQGVVESLALTGNQIRYRKIPATLDNLRMSLTENPIALHFSGHGIENNKENFGKDSALIKGEGNFLIFEDKEGCAQYLSEKRLHELLEASGTKLEFVFVASCYSQFAGEIFHNAGAKHVICVRRGEKISDEASIIFSKHFYHALFSQTRTVCQAFEIAKASLHAEKNKYVANEYHKFIILKDTDCLTTTSYTPSSQLHQDNTVCSSNTLIPQNCFIKKAPKKHKCSVFGPFMKGQATNIGTEPMFKLEVSKVEDFLGRRKEMQEVISNLKENRLVTIKGIPGIGKTTLAKAVGFYLDERNDFEHGIILLSLRRINQANMFLTRLYMILSKNIAKSAENEKEDKTKMEDQELLLQKIIDFLKDKRILLILDNVEDPLRVQGNDFKEILQTILTRCPQLTLLLTSRIAIGSLADISEKIIHLKELTPNYSLELLFKKAMRPITQDEIEELIRGAEPLRVYHINPHRENKFSLKLEEHHFLHLLGGHPHAISLAAPLLQDKSLKELYALLNSYDILDILGTDLIEGKQIAPLKMSLETSIEHMKANDPEAMKLFCLMGLLPGGCSDEDLDSLWGIGWYKCTERLLRASLLVKKNIYVNGENNKYTLLPFMNKFAEQKMSDEERLEFHRKCCEYFGKICKQLFYSNQNTHEKGMTMNDIMNRMIQIETNIWACIYRMLDYKKLSPLNQQDNSSLTRMKSPLPSQLNQLMIEYNQNNNQQYQQLKQMNKSNEESSQGESFERYDSKYEYDKYEEFLCKNTQYDRARSNSVRNNLHQRSLLGANENYQQDNISQNEEEEEKKVIKEKQHHLFQQKQQSSQYLKVEIQTNKDIDSDVADIEDKILYSSSIQNNNSKNNQMKDNLLKSQEENKRGEEQFFQDQDYDDQINRYDLNCQNNLAKSLQPPVYPTNYIANMLSDDFSQSFNQSPSAFMKISDQNLVFGGVTVQTDESENESLQSPRQELAKTSQSNDQQQSDFELPNFMRQASEEKLNSKSFNPSSTTMYPITKKNLQMLPIGLKQWPDGEESVASSIICQQDYLETSSVDSFLDQQFGFSQQQQIYNNYSPSDHYSLQHLTNNPKFKQPRKSLKTLVEPLNVVNEDVDKESQDNSVTIECQGEVNMQNNDQEEEEEEEIESSLNCQKMQKRISSKKYQEDELQEKQKNLENNKVEKKNTHNQSTMSKKSNNNNSQSQQICDEFQKSQQSQDNDANKKKKTVVFKLQKDMQDKNAIQTTSNQQTPLDPKTSKIEKFSLSSNTNMTKKSTINQLASALMLNFEGDLIVHYISNLVLFYKYADAYKAIQQFGIKLQETIARANLLKLSALIQFYSMNFTKEPYQQYEEALKLFKSIESIHGQAICNLAMGYILYTKASSFNDNCDENTIFVRANKRLSQALDQYKIIYHNMGQAFCHKILSQIREKQNKKDNQVKKHFSEYKALVRKDKELQGLGKSLFILRNQAGELVSLLIEVVNFQYEQSIDLMEQYYQNANLIQSKPSGIKPPTKFIQRPGSSMKKEEEKQFQGTISNLNDNKLRKQQQLKDQQMLSLQSISFNPRMQFSNGYETQKQLFDQITQDRNRKDKGEEQLKENENIKSSKPSRQTDQNKRKGPMIKKVFHKSVGKQRKDNSQNVVGETDKQNQDNAHQTSQQQQQQQTQNQQQSSSDNDLKAHAKSKNKVNLTNYGRESVRNYQQKKTEQIERKKLKKNLYNNSSFMGAGGSTSHLDQSQIQSTQLQATQIINNTNSVQQQQQVTFLANNSQAKKALKKTLQIVNKELQQEKKGAMNTLTSVNQSQISSIPFMICQNDDQEENNNKEFESDKSFNRSNKSALEGNTKEDLQEIESDNKRYQTLGGWNNTNLSGKPKNTQKLQIDNKKSIIRKEGGLKSSHKNSAQQSMKDLQNNMNSSNIAGMDINKKKEQKIQVSRPMSPHQQQKKLKEKESNSSQQVQQQQQYNCDSTGQVSEGTSSKQGVAAKQKITFNLRATMTIEDEKNGMIQQKDIQFNVEQVDQDS